jgi:hypothetical protein
MKKAKNKTREYILVGSTLLLMLMIGLSISPTINYSLIKKDKIEPKIKLIPIQQEQLAPSKTITLIPIGLGLLIILLVILRLENIINYAKCNRFTKRIFYKAKKHTIKSLKKIEKIPRIELKNLIDKIISFKIKNIFRNKHSSKAYSGFIKELLKTKDLFTEPYKPEFNHYFVMLLFVGLTVTMAVASVIFVKEQQATTNVVAPIIKTKVMEQLSPASTLSPWTIVIGIMIVGAAAFIKIKHEKSKTFLCRKNSKNFQCKDKQ